MKVIVIGAGVIGLATAWALARRGHEPVVLDQGPIPNPDGASHDQHRLIRYAYGGEAGYTRMVEDAFRAWADLWHDLGQIHYLKSGTIAVSSATGDESDLSRQTFEALGIPHEVLDRQALDEALPQYDFADATYGLFNPDGGPLFAERILGDLVRWLGEQRVELRAGRRIVGLDAEGPSVTIDGGEVVRGDRLVLATGAWTSKLMPSLKARTAPSRQVVVYVEPSPKYRTAWMEGPVLAQFKDGLDLYHLPPARGQDLKFSCSPHRRPGDPDDPREIGPDEGSAVLEHIRPHLRDGDAYRVLAAKVCYYGLSQTGRFIVQPIGGGAGLAITNCCGHMFKFEAVLGQKIAETLVGQLPLEAFQQYAAGQRGSF